MVLHGQQVAGHITADDVAEFNAILDSRGLGAVGTIDAPPAGSVTTLAADHVAHYLAQTQKPQLKTFWCGPAAAQSVILSWHNERFWDTTSAYQSSGLALSQSNLAKADYTNAVAGSTDWVDKDMKRALNRWLFDSDTEYYVQYSPDSVAHLEDHVATDVDIDWMVASDMYEKQGGVHYNGHPDKTIRHWTSIYGYSNSGATFAYQDPAGDSSALIDADPDWAAVHPYFDMSSTRSFMFMVRNGVTRGIVW